MIDYNAKAERMGWLPSAPQLSANPLDIADQAAQAGKDTAQYVAQRPKTARLTWRVTTPITHKTSHATYLYGVPTSWVHQAKGMSIS